MSAFMHTSNHITAIIRGIYTHCDPATVLFHNHTRTLASDPTTVGRTLLRANADSVAHLYGMTDLDNPADGGTRPLEYLEYLHQADTYEYDRTSPQPERTPEEILMALHSLEYQSCETPTWYESDAYAIIRAMQKALIQALPGYAEANTWSIA